MLVKKSIIENFVSMAFPKFNSVCRMALQTYIMSKVCGQYS